MNLHLLIGLAVMLGLIGVAASRNLLRSARAQHLAPVRIGRRSTRQR